MPPPALGGGLGRPRRLGIPHQKEWGECVSSTDAFALPFWNYKKVAHPDSGRATL